jgi:CheY-like chemotaxis protein
VPDVITLDRVMPRMDGLTVVRRLRKDPVTADIPIVIVTGRSSPADLKVGEASGVEAYITKPFEPAELVEVVRRLAEGGRGAARPQPG